MDATDGFTAMPDTSAMPKIPGFGDTAPAGGKSSGFSKRSKLPILSAEEGQRQLELKLEAERMTDAEFDMLWRELRQDAIAAQRIQETPFTADDARLKTAVADDDVQAVNHSEFDADFDYITEDGQLIDGADLVAKEQEAKANGANAPVQHISYDGEADSDADMQAIETPVDDTTDTLTFEEAVDKLMATVTRTPRFREIMRKTLKSCTVRRDLHDMETEIMGYPEYRYAAQNPYRIIRYLIDAQGLYLLELDEEGEVVTPLRKVGLTEDEVDDLIVSFALETTPVGEEVIEQLEPHKTISKLLGEIPIRFNSYLEVLDFCREPRTITEITELFKGRDLKALGTMHSDTTIAIQPSVFVDKLERAGALVWNDAWQLTPEGAAFLKANPFKKV